jgi:hypothetical protein
MREELRLGSHLIGQLPRGLFRKIGGASIDDGDKEVVVLRKGLVERPFVLPPRDIARRANSTMRATLAAITRFLDTSTLTKILSG